MPATSRAAVRLGRGVHTGVLLVFALLVFGWIQVPSVAPIAPAAVLLAYAGFAHLGVLIIAQGNPRTPWGHGGVRGAVRCSVGALASRRVLWAHRQQRSHCRNRGGALVLLRCVGSKVDWANPRRRGQFDVERRDRVTRKRRQHPGVVLRPERICPSGPVFPVPKAPMRISREAAPAISAHSSWAICSEGPSFICCWADSLERAWD